MLSQEQGSISISNIAQYKQNLANGYKGWLLQLQYAINPQPLSACHLLDKWQTYTNIVYRKCSFGQHRLGQKQDKNRRKRWKTVENCQNLKLRWEALHGTRLVTIVNWLNVWRAEMYHLKSSGKVRQSSSQWVASGPVEPCLPDLRPVLQIPSAPMSYPRCLQHKSLLIASISLDDDHVSCGSSKASWSKRKATLLKPLKPGTYELEEKGFTRIVRDAASS